MQQLVNKYRLWEALCWVHVCACASVSTRVFSPPLPAQILPWLLARICMLLPTAPDLPLAAMYIQSLEITSMLMAQKKTFQEPLMIAPDSWNIS